MLSIIVENQEGLSNCNNVHGCDFFLNKIPNVYKPSSFSASVLQPLHIYLEHVPNPPDHSSFKRHV